jgi:hypothetical protein
MPSKIVRTPRTTGRSRCLSSARPRRGGMELVFECAECGGDARLDNPRCYENALKSVIESGRPEVIRMRGAVERRYDGASVELMGQVADLVSRMRLLERHVSARMESSGTCELCLGRMKSGLSIMEGSLFGMEPLRALNESERLASYKYATSTGECGNCAKAWRSQVEDLAGRLSQLQGFIVQNMFGIVGESDG